MHNEDNLDNIDDLILNDDEPQTASSCAYKHSELEQLIRKHEKRLRLLKTLISDTKAAATLLNLECLRQFNNLRFDLQLRRQKQLDAITAAAPRMQAMMRSCLHIKPSMQAARDISRGHSKGPFFGQRI